VRLAGAKRGSKKKKMTNQEWGGGWKGQWKNSAYEECIKRWHERGASKTMGLLSENGQAGVSGSRKKVKQKKRGK